MSFKQISKLINLGFENDVQNDINTISELINRICKNGKREIIN